MDAVVPGPAVKRDRGTSRARANLSRGAIARQPDRCHPEERKRRGIQSAAIMGRPRGSQAGSLAAARDDTASLPLPVGMALGEDQGRVRRRVLLSALRMAGIGIGLGAVLALGTSRWLSAFLVGVRPRDPVMLAAVALLIAVVTAVAAYVPARRASRIDPLVALRSD